MKRGHRLLISKMMIKEFWLQWLFFITFKANYMTPCINFLFKVSNWYFKIFFLQFFLLLFIKIKNVFSICVSCHPLHDISKTPNFYWVPLTKQCKKMMPSFVHAVYDFFEFAQPEECLFCCLCVGTCKFISQIFYYFRIFTSACMNTWFLMWRPSTPLLIRLKIEIPKRASWHNVLLSQSHNFNNLHLE